MNAMTFRSSFCLTVVIVILSVTVMASVSLGAETEAPMRILRTSGNVRFGVIGGQVGAPAPTLLLVAMSLEELQREPVAYTEVARLLAAKGFVSVVIEPPCLGDDRRPNEPEGMAGWRRRLEDGEDVVQAFNSKAGAVLDHVVTKRLADPDRVMVLGISRGGFLAFHFAAGEPRVKAIAAISPVADLLALREFEGSSPKIPAKQLTLTHLAPKLIGRPVWVSIGNHDLRVDTDRTIAFTRDLVHATARQDKAPIPHIPVELIVGPSPGHRRIEQAHELAAVWLVKQLSAAAAPAKDKVTPE